MCDIKVDSTLPAGVVVRLIEDGGRVFQEVRVANKLNRLESQALPRIGTEGWLRKQVTNINSHPLSSLPVATVHRVRRGRCFLRKCGECGKRDGNFLLGMLTGIAFVAATACLTVITQPAKQASPAGQPARRSWAAWW